MPRPLDTTARRRTPVENVVFSTTDPFGFNTVGPGPNQSYIDRPGIEGTTLLKPDLRVDFIFGAVSSLSFGFAMSLGTGNLDGVTFTVFDAGDNVLASTSLLSDFTLPNGVNPSSFPEGQMSLAFGGEASYALFDFSQNQGTRYIIDNFEGTFGSSEDISPGARTRHPRPPRSWLGRPGSDAPPQGLNAFPTVQQAAASVAVFHWLMHPKSVR